MNFGDECETLEISSFGNRISSPGYRRVMNQPKPQSGICRGVQIPTPFETAIDCIGCASGGTVLRWYYNYEGSGTNVCYNTKSLSAMLCFDDCYIS